MAQKMGASRFAETEQNFAGALLTSPPQAPGPGRRRRSRKFGRGIGDRKTFCWRAVDFSSKRTRTSRPRAQKQNFYEGTGDRRDCALDSKILTEASGTEKSFAGAPLTSPLQGPGRQRRSRKFGRGIGDRKKFCWRAVDFASTRTRTSRPRPNLKAGKVQS